MRLTDRLKLLLVGVLLVVVYLSQACHPVEKDTAAAVSASSTPAAPVKESSPTRLTETVEVTSAVEAQILTPTIMNTPAAMTTSPTDPVITLEPNSALTPEDTPVPLSTFTSRLIRPGIEPSTYMTDTCQYLERRWSLDGSPPGTVVIPVMFHGIREGDRPITDNVTISESDFQKFIQFARQLGFETITTEQLIGFLYHNERIPARSLMMIVDDRRPGTIENHFLPVLEESNWTVTLGWIAGGNDSEMWQNLERLFATGRLDIQVHGYLHRYIDSNLPEDEMRQEIVDPIPLITEHFGQRPLAFIWPGGNFTAQAVQLVRQAGYRLGFTAYSRGPLLFNWIPLGEKERTVQDPLIVLPRGWSTALGVNLNLAVQVGEQARQFAEAHYPEEAGYYRRYCAGELPPLALILPPTPEP